MQRTELCDVDLLQQRGGQATRCELQLTVILNVTWTCIVFFVVTCTALFTFGF